LGTARQRLARAAYFTAIDVARAAQPGSGLTFGHDLSLGQFQGSLVQISMAPCQLVQTALLSRLCPNVRPDPGCPAKDYLASRYHLADGPGVTHFPEGLPDDYYDQLTAEYSITVYKYPSSVGQPGDSGDLRAARQRRLN
jgi:hypothetical protein